MPEPASLGIWAGCQISCTANELKTMALRIHLLVNAWLQNEFAHNICHKKYSAFFLLASYNSKSEDQEANMT